MSSYLRSGSIAVKSSLKQVMRPVYWLARRPVDWGLRLLYLPILQEVWHVGLQIEQSRQSCLDPACCHRPFRRDELSIAARQAARYRLGISSQERLIVSMGTVNLEKGVLECLHAQEQLRYWGKPVRLDFVGPIEPVVQAHIVKAVDELSLQKCVRFHDKHVSNQIYRDFLIAADCALQIRSLPLGGLSGAYLDCLCAGLPTVTNVELAETVQRPSFVTTVPDNLSPLLIAEQVLAVLQSADSEEDIESARFRNAEEYESINYAPQILKCRLAS